MQHDVAMSNGSAERGHMIFGSHQGWAPLRNKYRLKGIISTVIKFLNCKQETVQYECVEVDLK